MKTILKIFLFITFVTFIAGCSSQNGLNTNGVEISGEMKYQYKNSL